MHSHRHNEAKSGLTNTAIPLSDTPLYRQLKNFRDAKIDSGVENKDEDLISEVCVTLIRTIITTLKEFNALDRLNAPHSFIHIYSSELQALRMITAIIGELNLHYKAVDPKLATFLHYCHSLNDELQMKYALSNSGHSLTAVINELVVKLAALDALDVVDNLDTLNNVDENEMTAVSVSQQDKINDEWIIAEINSILNQSSEQEEKLSTPILHASPIMNITNTSGNEKHRMLAPARPSMSAAVSPRNDASFIPQQNSFNMMPPSMGVHPQPEQQQPLVTYNPAVQPTMAYTPIQHYMVVTPGGKNRFGYEKPRTLMSTGPLMPEATPHWNHAPFIPQPVAQPNANHIAYLAQGFFNKTRQSQDGANMNYFAAAQGAKKHILRRY